MGKWKKVDIITGLLSGILALFGIFTGIKAGKEEAEREEEYLAMIDAREERLDRTTKRLDDILSGGNEDE